MTKDPALVKRQALVLFNFLLQKQKNDKHIGDLTLGDIIELCEILYLAEPQKQSPEEIQHSPVFLLGKEVKV